MHLFPSPEPKVSCFDDLDFFKDFENEFLAIVYNDALTSKSDFLTEPTLSPQHIDEFDLKDETSLSEYDEVEQNVLYFNDLFPFNIIYPDDLKSDKDNDDNEIDIIQSSGGTDISKITRKPSKTGKHGHENGRVYKSRKQSQEKVNPQSNSQRKVKPWSTELKQMAPNPNTIHPSSSFHQAVKTKGFLQLRGTEVYSRAPKHNGKVNSVKSRAIISHSNNEAHVSLKKAHMDVGFALISLRKETQVSLKWIASLAIRVRSLSDLTAQNVDPMIG
ncbi:hypothetical protein Tco_0906049 [Tanacetum coccineum]